MKNPFGRKAEPSEGAVRRRFIAAARRDRPEWWTSVDFDDLWTRQRDDWTHTLSQRGVDIDPLVVLDHIVTHWSGGAMNYNSWWASHTAQEMGLLDGQCRPVDRSGPPINDEARRMSELHALGGSAAVAAYQSVFKEG